ncbi:hypothetical protein KFK09_005594 [Dendrobium nobile]|uniref:Uncharacterized protein n=1 Tax=Dendrobium nobile TaxID=94219 RepID=A0A8T3BW37_DENNO|nr:hypothetical protein KFK09_005594 [Dendrobium nobile]
MSSGLHLKSNTPPQRSKLIFNLSRLQRDHKLWLACLARSTSSRQALLPTAALHLKSQKLHLQRSEQIFPCDQTAAHNTAASGSWTQLDVRPQSTLHEQITSPCPGSTCSKPGACCLRPDLPRVTLNLLLVFGLEPHETPAFGLRSSAAFLQSSAHTSVALRTLLSAEVASCNHAEPVCYHLVAEPAFRRSRLILLRSQPLPAPPGTVSTRQINRLSPTPGSPPPNQLPLRTLA